MRTFWWIVLLIAIAIATALAIYLTPLKYIDLVPPPMHEVDPKAFYAEYQADPSNYIFIDVRTAQQYQVGHVQGSVNIPIGDLYTEHSTLPKGGKQIALICSNGYSAAVAYGYLQDWGFSNLIHITGGLQNWIAEGLPTVGSDNVDASASQ